MMGRLERAWYSDALWLHCLRPAAFLFGGLAARRRRAYRNGVRPVYRAPVPVIVVGNIAVGGTGKTPLVIALVRLLRAHGYHPGVVSRGYGGDARPRPRTVNPDSEPRDVGDEPLLIARRAGCPVVVCPRRADAVRHLLDRFACDVVLSDDGLQHYALARDIEIAVVDGGRGLGNGRLLPAGPLREGPERLEEVDFVVSNGAPRAALPAEVPPPQRMDLRATALRNLASGEIIPWPDEATQAGSNEPDRQHLRATRVHAVAGIGNPARFFDSLKRGGFAIIPHPLADHHRFRPADLAFDDALPIIMTEKDAVKCADFATDRCWFLQVEAVLPADFGQALLARLEADSRQGDTIKDVEPGRKQE